MPRSPPTSPWRLAAWAAPITAVLAIGLGGMRTGYSLRSVFLLGIAGAAIGAMIVPEIEPGSVRIPALWQMACGLLGGTLMAVAFGAGTLGILTSALAGIVLGFLAPYWMKYVNF